MTDEQAEQAAEQPPADDGANTPNVESLRVTVDADGMVVPDGDPAGQTVLTGQDAADAITATRAAGREQQAAAAEAQKAERESESKARKAPPEDKGR